MGEQTKLNDMKNRNDKINDIINAAVKQNFTDEIDEIYTLSYTDSDGKEYEDVFDYIDTTITPCSVHFIAGTGFDNFFIPLSQLTDESIEELHACISRDYTKAREAVYWSNPTKSEIAFGEGAIHYRTFPLEDVLKKDGTVKRWLWDELGRRWNYHHMGD